MTLIESLRDRNLFAGHFGGKSWLAWCAFLAALTAVWPDRQR
jgi:hypothetical protein